MQDHHRAADDCYAAGLLFIELGAEYKAISATKRAATSLERASHGCGEYSAPLTSSVIVSAPDNNADSSHSPPKKRTFREDAIKNRYLFLIMAVTFAAMSVFLFIDGSVFIGLLTAVVAAMFGVTALLGFIGRHDGAKSQE